MVKVLWYRLNVNGSTFLSPMTKFLFFCFEKKRQSSVKFSTLKDWLDRQQPLKVKANPTLQIQVLVVGSIKPQHAVWRLPCLYMCPSYTHLKIVRIWCICHSNQKQEYFIIIEFLKFVSNFKYSAQIKLYFGLSSILVD